MIVPPAILDLRIAAPDRKAVHVWLPLFLLWPLGFVFVVLGLVLTIVVDAVLLAFGQRYHHYTLLFAHLLGLFNAMRGMTVHINDGRRTAVDMTVR